MDITRSNVENVRQEEKGLNLNPTMFGLRLKRSGGRGVMNTFGTCFESYVSICPVSFNKIDVCLFKIYFSEKAI